MKKSESLAIENIRRIAEQLRAERNDAVALGQVMREDLEEALSLLRQISARDIPLSGADREHITKLL